MSLPTRNLADCTATDLLRHYGVSYVEIPTGAYAQQFPRGNLQWWRATFPVIAEVGGVTVFDVRSVSR